VLSREQAHGGIRHRPSNRLPDLLGFALIHSAAYRPQPKAAARKWSGFDLESQDLQPDDPVNHRDGAAMNGFVDLHGESITGQCHQDKAFLKRSLNIQNGFASIGLSYPIKWR